MLTVGGLERVWHEVRLVGVVEGGDRELELIADLTCLVRQKPSPYCKLKARGTHPDEIVQVNSLVTMRMNLPRVNFRQGETFR